MKSLIAMIGGLFFVASASYAGITIDGTKITFSDNTMQSTAAGGGGGGAPADHGGTGNTVGGTDSFIGGGFNNVVSGDYATISGGNGSTASSSGSTVGGGFQNTTSGEYAAVGGGRGNKVTDNFGTIGGGYFNQAGDADPSTLRKHATVGGGRTNTASGSASTVSGGQNNEANGYGSTVGGGIENIASGRYSFAAGFRANATHDSSFVWGGDSFASGSSGNRTFNVHAPGGIFLDGVEIHSSDRNKKKDFTFVSAREILDKVVELPIQTWRFKTEEDSISHIGPMAQDFMAAFGYGLDERYLSTLDMDGVTLAAIQGLYELQREELQEQSEVNTALRWHNAQLEARLARLENAILRERERAPTGTD